MIVSSSSSSSSSVLSSISSASSSGDRVDDLIWNGEYLRYLRKASSCLGRRCSGFWFQVSCT